MTLYSPLDLLLATVLTSFVGYTVSWILAGAWAKAPCRAALGDALFGFIFYPCTVMLACDSSWQLLDTRETRWRGTTSSSQILGALLAGRMLVHIPYMFLKRSNSGGMRKVYIVHHLIVILVYGGGALRQRAHFWGSAAALCEMTNVFLCVTEYYEAANENVQSKFVCRSRYVIRLAFGLSYVILRLGLFPFIIIGFLNDVSRFIVSGEASIFELGLFEVFLYPIAMLAVFSMSVYWAKAAYLAFFEEDAPSTTHLATSATNAEVLTVISEKSKIRPVPKLIRRAKNKSS
mmetsp:Transcript_1042/g.1515  ORF Transcript_1042/g.1515 Transcript_1042/m.1515 type:complete len:290 (+) Transcript_1042:97-966(+)